MKRRLTIFALLASLAACGVPADPPRDEALAAEPTPLTAAHLADLIAADGAAHTVAVLTGPADPTGLDPIFAGIATGDAAWLSVVPSLRPVVGGVYADGLADALARALPMQPSGVLTALQASGGASPRICRATGDPDMIAAVEGVADPALRDVRTDCLAFLRGQ
ncbi:hypothetical protein BZG35_11495 [Brevundimonas sp. LM2]|uniref:hypothetical protein n=1 Tax=Brevundimonas sp. LM2 TaxID=1938605 RepID=UPI000983C6B6|nr:hypothetical protein [Brevundimonas sp. LM2]AQR62198.1 hypothetical protein BZG35_11495 [Brevundimonas sp. LM2]